MSPLFSTCVVMGVAVAASEAKLPTNLDLTTIRGIVVEHDGRWPPLDTVARDLVESVTGEQSPDGIDPVLLLLAWTFDPDSWADEPLIRIGNAELRTELELPSTETVFSYSRLLSHEPFRRLSDELARMERGRKMNPLEAKVSDITEKLHVLQLIFNGMSIRPIPDPEDMLASWRPIRAEAHGASASDDEVRTTWTELADAFRADDGPAFASASKRLAAAVNALPAAHRPRPERIATELRYNRLQPFRTAWMIMVVAAGLAALAMFLRPFHWLAVLGLVVGFGTLTYGLMLRWEIAGRIPAANMYESLLFLSWGMGAFAIVAMLTLRHRIVPFTASVMGAVALMLADFLPMDGFVRPIVPVLMDTFWMSIHVPVIMVSYSVLALGVLMAHIQLGVMALVPRQRKLIDSIDSLHYWYIHVGAILLLAGVVTGSMWGASSWGRYWGWDPKEVWSLVALLGYLAILHVRLEQERVPAWQYVVGLLLTIALAVIVVPKLAPITLGKGAALIGTAVAMGVFVLASGRFATAVKSILAFWLIIMTYVGVNYVLGIGLHSYGFGTGAVVHYMFLLGGIDLALVVLLALVYLAQGWRSRSPDLSAQVARVR